MLLSVEKLSITPSISKWIRVCLPSTSWAIRPNSRSSISEWNSTFLATNSCHRSSSSTLLHLPWKSIIPQRAHFVKGRSLEL